MREIPAEQITETVARLCQEANYYLGEEELEALKAAVEREESPVGRGVLGHLLENARIAAEEQLPLCQDCGFTVVLLELGQDSHIVGGNLYDAVHEGVRRGYGEGYLRKSVVDKPLTARVNTRDNTPAVIHTDIVPGDQLRIVVGPKGAGSENMTGFAMLTPAQGAKGMMDLVVQTVEKAGPNPCPPLIVGVGVGGTADKAMYLAKRAIFRPIGSANSDPEVADLEQQLLQRINGLGIGPLGFGGRITAFAVHIETFPSHIASLPVAVNLQCHSARHKEATL